MEFLDLHLVDLYGTLWSTNIAGWNITMFNRKYMFKGVHCPFSIWLMLVYKSVNLIIDFNPSEKYVLVKLDHFPNFQCEN